MSHAASRRPPRAIAALRFRALGDETRLRILEELVAGEAAVSDLTERLEVGQSLMSHHLRILREAGLVVDRRATGAGSTTRFAEPALASCKCCTSSSAVRAGEPMRGRTGRARDAGRAMYGRSRLSGVHIPS